MERCSAVTAACTRAVLCILLQISLHWNILLTQDSPHDNRKDDLSLSGCSLISSDTHLTGRRPLFALTARVNYKPVNLLSHLNINYLLHKTIKHGYTTLVLPARLFVMDLTISMDVSANPGPVNSEITISPRRLRNGIADLNSPAKKANGTLSSVYSKEQLLALKTRAPVPSNVYQLLKQREIFRSRYTRSKKKAKKAKSKINNFQAPSFSPFENGHSYYSYSGSLNLNNNDTSNNSQHLQPIAVRITSQHEFVQNNKQRGRNQNNIIDIAKKNQLNNREKLRFSNWNAQSVNKKSASICDFVISKRLDLLALTETWLSSRYTEHLSVAEITNTLQDYFFFHQPRMDKANGGVGLLLRKGFTVKVNEVFKYKSMEYMDFKITARDTSFRLLVIYRIHPSRKNKLTSPMFFEKFSTLLENLIVTPEYL